MNDMEEDILDGLKRHLEKTSFCSKNHDIY